MSASRTTVREIIAALSKYPPSTPVVGHSTTCEDRTEGQLDGVSVYAILGYEVRSGWNVKDYNGGTGSETVVVLSDQATPEDLIEMMDG